MFDELVLIYTRQCTMECDICMLECSPQIRDKMCLEDAIRYIEEAAQIKRIKRIGISGGEPFIFFDEILQVCHVANKYKFEVGIITNGFWAESQVIAREKLMLLKEEGLKRLELSIDAFHLKKVNLQNIIWIIKECINLQIYVEINTVITKANWSKISIEEILKKEGIEGITINEMYCIPVGRAKKKIPDNDFYYQEKIPNFKCTGQKSLTIYPTGEVYPCCRHSSVKSEILIEHISGNIRLEEIIENYKNNIFAKVIRKKGFSWFIGVLNEKVESNKYVNECGICDVVFEKNEYKDLYIEKIKEEIKNYCEEKKDYETV